MVFTTRQLHLFIPLGHYIDQKDASTADIKIANTSIFDPNQN